MSLLTENQSLLLKSCFLQNGSLFFKQWLSTYSETNLDYYTRALIPSLITALSSSDLTPQLHRKMLNYKRQTWLVNSLKWQRLKPILDDFSKAGIACCLLKGAAMVFFYYNDVSQRPEYSDVDILIAKQDLMRAKKILKAHQFIPQKTLLWSGADLDNQLGNCDAITDALHAVHYKKDGLVIDLHWRLFPFIKGLDFDILQIQMLSQHRLGNKLLCFTPEMQFIHTATHIAFQDRGYASLNSIIDLCFLLQKETIDIPKLAGLSAQLNLTGLIFTTVKKLKPYTNDATYAEFKRSFYPTFIQRYFSSFLYSPSNLKRRFAQVYFILKKNQYHPMKTLRNMRYYSGAIDYKQLFFFVFKRVSSSISSAHK